MIFEHKIDDEVSLVLRDDSFVDSYVDMVQNNAEHLKPFSDWMPRFPADFDEDKASEYLKEYRTSFAEGKGFYMGITYKGQHVGEIGYNEITRHKSCSLGYWLIKSATGKGIIHRALKEVLFDAFVTRELNRVVLEIATHNTPSINVAKKMGFIHEGITRESGWLHDTYADYEIWSMLKREYKPR